MHTCERWLITVSGAVQGVGFRPFVYRLAKQMHITGQVQNTPKGVLIEAQGKSSTLGSFLKRLRTELPPLANIENLDFLKSDLQSDTDFVITKSAKAQKDIVPAIPPDISTCDDCLTELLSKDDRRYRYPFTNCTNCGPRYTIIEGFPYDRAKTSMKSFDMCDKCSKEYTDPMNRRFHAQPNACPTCGPVLKLLSKNECSDHHKENSESAPIADALKLISDGKIVAVKGLGGYHLACDATNSNAVKTLRKRKNRDMKPFAIMVKDLEAAKGLCEISEQESKLLTSPRRPIVLLKKLSEIPVAREVAPQNNLLGVMLPYTPLHHLLFEGSERRILVMTSANFSEEPIIANDEKAKDKLKDITDAFLTHNRPIHIQTDDSVIRPVGRQKIMIRRARGYVPAPITMPINGPKVLALGGDLKNAICLTQGNNAYLSQYLGDLQNIETHKHFEDTIEHLCSLLKIEPEIIACDMHPDYFSSQHSAILARNSHASKNNSRVPEYQGTRVLQIQHHHAHIASCMAENSLPNQDVIGIALDGTGFGTDGTVWGGEILKASYKGFERLGRIKPVALPGGDIAAKEPWRMALAYLGKDLFERIPHFKDIPKEKVEVVWQAIEKKINSPLTSSCGRLFDAVAAIVGIANYNAYEGHAAMILEQAADEKVTDGYNYVIESVSAGLIEIDFAKTLSEIANNVVSGIDKSKISAKFHNTVISAFAEAAHKVAGSKPIVLSGGCMQNALLLSGLLKTLENLGHKTYTHKLIPPNDGGIALGQAIIALHKQAEFRKTN